MYFEQTFHLLNALVGLYDPGTLQHWHNPGMEPPAKAMIAWVLLSDTALWPPHIPDSGIGHSSVIDTIRNIVFRQGLLQK